MGKKRKILLIGLPVIVLVILTGWYLFGQTPQPVPEPTPLPQAAPSTPSTQSLGTPETSPSTTDTETPEELPPNLLVVPEVPLGSLTIVIVCLFALLITQRKSKSPLPLTLSKRNAKP